MNIRQIKILEKLNNSDKETYADFASIFNVSSRTIRNDINDLNELMRKHSSKIIRDNDGYLKIQTENVRAFQSFLREINSDNLFDYSISSHRIIYISLSLLMANDYSKMDSFLDKLFISKTTLNKDFASVKKIFKRFKVGLKTKPGYGIKVVANEKSIRKAIYYSIQLLNEETLVMDYSTNTPIINKEYNEIIENIIKEKIKNKNINMSDLAFNNLVLHLVITVVRIKKKKYIELNILKENDLIQSIRKNEHFQIAKDIVVEIEKVMDINFPVNEIIYITSHLMGINILKDFHIDNKKIDFDILIEKVIGGISQLTGLEFTKDDDLYYGLLMHLKPAIYRYKNNIYLKNPLLDSIKINYAQSFELAVKAAQIIKNNIDIQLNEDEIGYLAIHIGTSLEKNINNISMEKLRCLVVCATGFGTSRLMRLKLESLFNDKIEIIDVVQVYSISNYSLSSYDFIVSNIKIENNFNKDIIVIKNILDNDEYKRISRYIEYKTNILNYISEENIYPLLDFNKPKELLKFICNDLVLRSQVNKGIYESIIEREKISSSSIGNLIAIPHPLNKMSEKTFWTIFTLKDEIRWGDNNVRFVILLNVVNEDKMYLDTMYENLLKLINNKTYIDELLDINDSKIFYNRIKEMLE